MKTNKTIPKKQQIRRFFYFVVVDLAISRLGNKSLSLNTKLLWWCPWSFFYSRIFPSSPYDSHMSFNFTRHSKNSEKSVYRMNITTKTYRKLDILTKEEEKKLKQKKHTHKNRIVSHSAIKKPQRNWTEWEKTQHGWIKDNKVKKAAAKLILQSIAGFRNNKRRHT